MPQWISDMGHVASHTRFLLLLLRTSGQWRNGLEWLRSMRPGYLLEKPSLWMTFDALREVRRRLKPGMRVFEYGSGGSTLFWLAHGATVVSIEHDPEWYNRVRERIAGAVGIDYRLVLPEAHAGLAPHNDPGDPEAYLSDDIRYSGKHFRTYVSQISTFADGYFDIVLVDGRARTSCMVEAAPKVRPGGMLVLDNADREYYLRNIRSNLEPFVCKRYYGAGPCNAHLWRTDIYARPG